VGGWRGGDVVGVHAGAKENSQKVLCIVS